MLRTHLRCANPRCGAFFSSRMAHAKYCSSRCRFQARPGSGKRGYGWPHQLMRRQVAAQVKAGRAICVRCLEPIKPDEPWDLGHHDLDRSVYAGPEHARCNRATSGRLKPKPSRNW